MDGAKLVEPFILLGALGFTGALFYFVWRRRASFLEKVSSRATPGFERLKDGLFDRSSTPLIDDREKVFRAEGVHGGEPMKLSAGFPTEVNGPYFGTSDLAKVVAELSITVGLHGATPRFSVKTVFGHNTKTIEIGDELADIREELTQLLASHPEIHSIVTDGTGLTIAWTIPAGLSATSPLAPVEFKDDAPNNVRKMGDLALEIKRQILHVLERPVRTRVASEQSYRGDNAPSDEALEEDDQEGDEEIRNPSIATRD